ncbi:unnamed protein product, partial [Symbiodinium sp. KB8]
RNPCPFRTRRSPKIAKRMPVVQVATRSVPRPSSTARGQMPKALKTQMFKASTRRRTANWWKTTWSGAYASPKASNRPQYDSIVLPTNKDKKISREEVRVDSRDSLLRREVQKALSQARKADNRVRKLRDEKDTREAQWAQYVKESREAYLKEKARYEGHLQRIDDEIKGTMEAGKEASAQVQSLILNGPPTGSDAVRPMEEEDTSWDALIGAEPQLEPGFFEMQYLRPGRYQWRDSALPIQLEHNDPGGSSQALADGHGGTTSGSPTRRSGSSSSPAAGPASYSSYSGSAAPDIWRTSWAGSSSICGAAAGQQAASGGASAHNSMSPGPASHRVAPYPPASPTQPPPVEVTEAATEEQHLEHGQPRPAQPKLPRQDVKSATKSPPVKPSLGSTDMQTKLEAKRTQARDGLAMRPFGGRPTAPTDQPGQARDSDAAQRPPAGLIDDDLDTTSCPTGEELGYGDIACWRCLGVRLIGHYFAAILPHEIAFRTLHDYFWPLTTLDDDPCDVYVGFQDDPILPGSDIQLADGDVITVLKRPGGFFYKYRASAMFEPGAQWASPSNWFRLHPCTSVCVLYGDKRFVVPEHHHYGQNLVAYVSDRLRLNPYSAAMCTFPITDLDVQGNLCHFIVAVSEVPSPEVTGTARTSARDLFVLLDPRPLGQKPCFLFLHHPVVHLPTVEATLGLSTGRNRRLGVRGGTRRGEDIHVEGSTTLLLFAEEIGEESLDSDSSVPEDTPASSSSADVEDLQHQATQPAVAAQEHPLPGVLEVAQEDPWGQDPPLTMLGLDLFDPTLPQGHSWNANSVVPFSAAMGDPISPARQNPHGADDTADNLSRRDDAHITAPVKLQVLVYVPDFVPEIVEVEVSLPAAIETLLAKLRLARPPEQASSFSILSPASPQPLRSLAIFVAGPVWQSYTVVILVDCRRYNGCMFARAVPHSLNRESLMQAAGVPADEAVHVYVHGLIQPLALDQRITLLHGMTVSFVPRTENGPASHDLADMLLSNDGWDSIVPIPGPRAHINSHCYLLTDTRHFTMAIQADRRSEFREDVAQAAGAAEHRLSICTAKPRVLDAYPFGYWATSVLVATELLSRVPCPPARVPETRLILVLDQRRILRGFDWKLIGNAFVSVQELADSYHNMCPVGHVVSLEGARLEYRGEEQVFVVQHGQILTVEFVPESLDAGSEGPPPESPDSSVPQALPDVATSTQPASTAAPSTAGTATSPTQPRSRSPRGRTGQNNLQACELHVTIPKLELRIRKVPRDHPYSNSCMWCKGPLTTAFLDGTPSITPAVLLSQISGAACTLSHQRHLVQCKLLCEPTGGMSADTAIDRARHATRLLGDAWPRPPYRWPIDDVSEDVEVLQEATPSENVTIDIVVYLLTPDYHPEKLDLTVQLPQTVEELADLVQTCRDQARHCLFPTLVEVIQQPDPGWALFLALPPWPRTRAVVCMDLSFFDGRVFANTVPEQPDVYDLCEAAGLGPVAEVDIFVPGLNEPLQHGIRIDLQTGMTIVFMMPGVARPPPFSLAAMLRTHLPWEHSPVFPRDRLDNGYCVAGPRGQVLFRLHPERACFYRSDIALLADLHPLRAVVTPANPPQTDVCVRGWTCRAVVAATDRDDQVTWDGHSTPATVGLLDCRPLLLGWLPVSTKTHWLDLRPIARALLQSAPEGWQVVFPTLPSHWTWVCLAPGQTLTVTFAEIPVGREVALAPAWPASPVEPDDPEPDPDDIRMYSSSSNAAPASSWDLPPMSSESNPTGGTRAAPAGTQALKSGAVICVILVLSCLAGTLAQHTNVALGKTAFCVCALALHAQPLPALLCLADTVVPSEAASRIDATPAETPKLLGIYRPLPTPTRAGLPRVVSSYDWRVDAAPDSTTTTHLLTPSYCQMPPPDPKGDKDLNEALPLPSWGPDTHDSDSAEPRHYALITLLEESVASPSSEAFMLASTLLDTLAEALAEQSTSHLPVTISLSCAVPPPAFNLDQEQIRLPHSQALLRSIYCPWPGTWVLPPEWRDDKWPPSTRQGLIDTRPWTALFASTLATDMSFSLYTDGSAMSHPSCSGYAVILLVHVQSETALLGILGGQILGNASFPWTVEGPPALHAEHTAIAVAILWALQLRGQVQKVHCKVLFDCTAAGWAAEGTWRATGATGEFVHQLDMIAKATPGIRLEYEHVRGHSGDPWNDLADYVAKTAASQASPWPGPPLPLCKALQEHDIAWIAPEVDARVHHAVPILDEILAWAPQNAHGATLTPAQLVPVATRVSTKPSDEPAVYATVAVTVNVQSLRAKCKYIEEQLEAKQVNVAFLQETKLSGGTVVSQHYLLIVAVVTIGELKIGLVSGVAGDLEFGEPDEAGWRFAALLADNGMWIPSTFPYIHCGEVITYIHPSGQPQRIDYLFVGGKASITQARSEVDENFDTGSPQEDHKLLQVCIKGHMDPAKAPALSSYVHPGWDVSPDQHCHALEQFLHKELTAHFAVPPKNRRATYIPDSVWQLREKKVSFKRRVRHRASLWTALLCRAFHLWRTGQEYGVLALLGKQRLLYELSSAAIRFITAMIKRSITAAKNTFLQGVAGEDHQGATKILQRVKQAGMGGRSSRPISRPLPLLLHPEDGSVLTTRVQRDAVWMLHFGKQEQGQALPIESFIREAASSCLDANVEWSIDMLPSYSDIEQVLRDMPRNKAAGLDNIPGEVLKAAPAAAARFLFPLFIKSMLLQRQPLQWRGGILYEALKRSGLQSSVENYRSLFVSSYVAKTYHRVVRNKTQSYCRDELHPMHLGSRRQAPVTFASLFVLSHMRWCHRTKISAAVLFLDTSAAYYRLVRELAVGDIRSDDTVVNLFRTFGLDEDDLRELLHTVQEGGMLAQAGAPDALRQVVKDLHLHTWFVSRFSDGTRVCSSLAGSRPGESWADLIYAYIYGRVLHKVHEYAVAEQLTHSVPYDSTAGIFATDQCDEELSATDTTWADDSAFPLADADPEALVRKTIRLCTLVISFCEGHGMAPNLKPGKTGVLLSLQGKGSKQARRRFFPEGTQRLHLPDLDVGVAVLHTPLPIAHWYTGCWRLELVARTGRASAWRRGLNGIAFCDTSPSKGKALTRSVPDLEAVYDDPWSTATVDCVLQALESARSSHFLGICSREEVEDLDALLVDVQDHIFGEMQLPTDVAEDVQTPRSVMAMRFINGLSQLVGELTDPPALKTVTETLGFQHLDIDVTTPRAGIFRNAILELFEQELGANFGGKAKAGLQALMNYVGGAIIYVRREFSERFNTLRVSWIAALGLQTVSLVLQFYQVYDTENDKKPVSKGMAGTKVPQNFNEMFTFNAAVMGFSNSLAWMNPVLDQFEAMVMNAANSYRLQEECDVLSLVLVKYKETIIYSEFKAVMLASLRSLVPKIWGVEHEVAWTWFWDNTERMIKRQTANIKGYQRAADRFIRHLTDDVVTQMRKDVYKVFFGVAPKGQDYFKQSSTRLNFIADKVLEMSLEMYKRPRGMVEEISALGLRFVFGRRRMLKCMDNGQEPTANDQIVEVTGKPKEALQQLWADYGPDASPFGVGSAIGIPTSWLGKVEKTCTFCTGIGLVLKGPQLLNKASALAEHLELSTADMRMEDLSSLCQSCSRRITSCRFVDTPEIKNLIARRKRLHGREARDLAKQIADTRRRAKKEWLATLLLKSAEGDYRAIAYFKKRNTVTAMYTQGSYCIRAGGRSKAIADLRFFYQRKYTPPDPTIKGLPRAIFHERAGPILNPPPFTLEEVRDVAFMCKHNKSTGADGISYEALQMLLQSELAEHILDMYNGVLQGLLPIPRGTTPNLAYPSLSHFESEDAPKAFARMPVDFCNEPGN